MGKIQGHAARGGYSEQEALDTQNIKASHEAPLSG
jgi:hypothetical protein